MTTLEIREMTRDDIAPAVAMMDSGGWRGRGPHFEWVLSAPTIDPIVGFVDGRLAAIGQGTRNGPVGWVGSIFVDPGMRRQGFGRAITEEVCRRLEAAGCRTLALIASDLGRPIYLQMGFRIDAWYQIWDAPTLYAQPLAPAGTRLRPMAASDVDRVGALDRRATGEDRRGLLGELTDSTWLLETEDGSEVLGYLAQTHPDIGAVVAPDPEDATCLLDLLRHRAAGRSTSARAALIRQPDGEVGERARSMLAARGWSPRFETPRMLRGPKIDWDPGLIWGVLGFGFG